MKWLPKKKIHYFKFKKSKILFKSLMIKTQKIIAVFASFFKSGFLKLIMVLEANITKNGVRGNLNLGKVKKNNKEII